MAFLFLGITNNVNFIQHNDNYISISCYSLKYVNYTIYTNQNTY
jgi:hypothetical protein